MVFTDCGLWIADCGLDAGYWKIENWLMEAIGPILTSSDRDAPLRFATENTTYPPPVGVPTNRHYNEKNLLEDTNKGTGNQPRRGGYDYRTGKETFIQIPRSRDDIIHTTGYLR